MSYLNNMKTEISLNVCGINEDVSTFNIKIHDNQFLKYIFQTIFDLGY